MIQITGQTKAGVCDRIAIALQGHKIAKAVSGHMWLHWDNTPQCDCPPTRLFTPISPNLTISPIPLTGQHQYLTGSLQSKIDQIRTKGDGSYQIGMSGHNFDDFDDVFIPSDEVTEIIQKFKDQNWRKHMIGVHVRRGDKMKARHRPPSVEQFIEATAQTIKLVKDQDCGIFLATDGPKVIDHFRRVFADHLIVMPVRSLARSNHDGIVDAVATLFLLRATECVIGCDYSGYSLLAGWHSGFVNVPCSGYRNLDWDGRSISLAGPNFN